MRLALVLMMCVGTACGQQTHKGCVYDSTQPHGSLMECIDGKWVPGPLKCGKYEHEEKLPQRCANTCPPDGTSCIASRLVIPASDECVPDMHTVTEKEWQDKEKKYQDLLERLKNLESSKQAMESEPCVAYRSRWSDGTYSYDLQYPKGRQELNVRPVDSGTWLWLHKLSDCKAKP